MSGLAERVAAPFCVYKIRKHRWEFVGVDSAFESKRKPARFLYVTFGCERCGATISERFVPDDSKATLPAKENR